MVVVKFYYSTDPTPTGGKLFAFSSALFPSFYALFSLTFFFLPIYCFSSSQLSSASISILSLSSFLFHRQNE